MIGSKLACIAIVEILTPINVRTNRFVAIRDTKHRGIILPGGKLEYKDVSVVSEPGITVTEKRPAESLRECAIRELREETKLYVPDLKLVFQAHDTFGYYVYAFHGTVQQKELYNEHGEMALYGDQGDVVEASWFELMESQYQGYYDLLRDAIDRR